MNKYKEKPNLTFEEIYPQLISFILVIFISYILNFDIFYKEIDNLLNGIITFSSIVVGFTGALLGIILSIRDTDIVKEIFNDTKKEFLMKYFRASFISGLFVVILSCVLYYIGHICGNLFYTELSIDKIIVLIWFYMVLFFALSSYRIIDIVMRIVFNISKKSNKTKRKNQSVDEKTEKELQNKYK